MLALEPAECGSENSHGLLLRDGTINGASVRLLHGCYYR